MTISRLGLILMSVVILFRCLRSMLSDRYEDEVWGYLKASDKLIPIYHWENIIGKGFSSDLRIFGPGIGWTHAILRRNDSGEWSIHDVFSKGGVWVNSERVPHYGTVLQHGDLINLGGSCVTFLDEPDEIPPIAQRMVNPAVTLIELSIFQVLLLTQLMVSAQNEYKISIAVAFAVVICLQWLLYEGMRLLNKSGFEIETLAFYLTSLGLAVAASSTPEDMVKQMLLIIAGVVLFAIGGWWQSSLERTKSTRIPVGILAIGLLALNIFAGYSQYGAANWLTFGGYSFQPSEIVKVLYIYVGAATLEMLYKKNNLYIFIAFSAVCVIALAAIGDFGTAVVFFATFLVISFMRSGSIATVMLAITGAGMAGFLAISVKPYIARRFATWGHVWEDIYDTGFQQTRAMAASASGGLIGKGAGNGWLKNIFAANTDMVFAFIAEELGLIIAVCMVLSVVLMALFAVRETKRGRSAYYSIAACATVSMLLVQMALNVFGSLDLLPFTGVTFPFVSRGGTSLLSCWMLMAFLKSADNRLDASFAVKTPSVTTVYEDEDTATEEADYQIGEMNNSEIDDEFEWAKRNFMLSPDSDECEEDIEDFYIDQDILDDEDEQYWEGDE